jgi:hypothetical protein
VIRQAAEESSLPSPFDFLLFGPADLVREALVWQAWELALQRGLSRDRLSARLGEVRPLAWDGTPLAPAFRQPGFPLAPLPWPAAPDSPCRLLFPCPLRLLREGRLITMPALADLALAALRRFQTLAPEAAEAAWQRRHEWLDRARAVPATLFEGRPLDLVRYSGRQRADIEVRGVAGTLVLPEGPGPLADLLLAASWLHLGKSTVMGLGRLCIEPLPAQPAKEPVRGLSS